MPRDGRTDFMLKSRAKQHWVICPECEQEFLTVRATTCEECRHRKRDKERERKKREERMKHD